MKICIGIISYFPEKIKIRNNRLCKLIKLIEKCNELFDLPIYIIAQNWKDLDISMYKNVNIIKYENRLGIVGARKELRKWFLESNYDYLIMLDDDCELKGNKESGNKYIDQIKNHPGMCGLFNQTLLKLFAISKELFKEIDYGDGSVEDGDFFEDILFVNSLKKLYSNKIFIFNKNGLYEISNNYNDPLSTWYTGQFNKKEIGDRTRKILEKIKEAN